MGTERKIGIFAFILCGLETHFLLTLLKTHILPLCKNWQLGCQLKKIMFTHTGKL
jgi:hypothetical protein